MHRNRLKSLVSKVTLIEFLSRSGLLLSELAKSKKLIDIFKIFFLKIKPELKNLSNKISLEIMTKLNKQEDKHYHTINILILNLLKPFITLLVCWMKFLIWLLNNKDIITISRISTLKIRILCSFMRVFSVALLKINKITIIFFKIIDIIFIMDQLNLI